MEAKTKVKLKSLEPYRALFPKARNIDRTVKMGASVSDTVDFIPKVIRSTTWQVENYVKRELSGMNPYMACEKLWYFVKYHIKYEADARGIEMVRSPRRFISDAKGDCDCGTTYIGACILSLSTMVRGIKSIVLRITKYKRDYFQHIYPIVVLTDGTEIIMDFVVERFNYEEPYTEKKDSIMELQYLDGIEESDTQIIGMAGYGSLSELGKILRKNAAKKSAAKAAGGGGILKKRTPEKKQAAKAKRKAVGKKLLKVANVVNKVNPGIALLRAGILAGMKTNLMKIAESLRWAYATPELASSKGMDMSKYPKLKEVLAKTEKIFFGAGGKPENLKKAILTGRGNRDKSVAGIEGFDGAMPISELLGAIYNDEFVNGLEGVEEFDGFGAVATGAAVAAASSTMGALAALIKSIGSLFPGKKKKANTTNDDAPGEDGEGSSVPDPGPRADPSEVEFDQETPEEATGEEPDPESESLPATVEDEPMPSGEESGSDTSEETTEGLMGIGSGIKNFYQKNKKWLVPVSVVVVTVGAIALMDHLANRDKALIEPHYQPVNGPPRKRSRSRKGGKKGSNKKHEIIALM